MKPLPICTCDVPRNANGWPTIEPEHMSEYQLRKEAESWRYTARNTHPGTVGYGCWKQYCEELRKRGLIEELDLDVNLMEVYTKKPEPKAPPAVQFWNPRGRLREILKKVMRAP